MAAVVLAGNARAQGASASHVVITAQPTLIATAARNVAYARSDSQRAIALRSASIHVGRADTASHPNTWHPIRVGALIGGGLGLIAGVIADATQSGPTKIYGLAPTGGLIVGALGGAVIGAVLGRLHSH